MLRHIFEDLPGRPDLVLPMLRIGQPVSLAGVHYRVEATELSLSTGDDSACVYVRTAKVSR